jgi:hypothetical protein
MYGHRSHRIMSELRAIGATEPFKQSLRCAIHHVLDHHRQRQALLLAAEADRYQQSTLVLPLVQMGLLGYHNDEEWITGPQRTMPKACPADGPC